MGGQLAFCQTNMITACLHCDVILPELEDENIRLKKILREYQQARNPLNPLTRDRMIELERRNAVLVQQLDALCAKVSQLERHASIK